MVLLLSLKEKLKCYWMFIASAIDWPLHVGWKWPHFINQDCWRGFDLTIVFLPQLWKAHSSIHQSSFCFSRVTDLWWPMRAIGKSCQMTIHSWIFLFYFWFFFFLFQSIIILFFYFYIFFIFVFIFLYILILF